MILHTTIGDLVCAEINPDYVTTGVITVNFKDGLTDILDVFPAPRAVGNRVTLTNGYYLQITGAQSGYPDVWTVSFFNPSNVEIGGHYPAFRIWGTGHQNSPKLFQFLTVTNDFTQFGILCLCHFNSGSRKYISDGYPVSGSTYPVGAFSGNPVSTEWMQTNIGNMLVGSFTPQTYFPGDTSSPGGGGGSFDKTSDDIDFPNPPTLSAVSAGFITLFSPTTSQLNDLASYMWSSAFDLDTFKKLFADPMDAIIGVSIVPVPVPVSGSQNVKIGFVDTGVSMNVATTQYVTVDCGTLTPAEYWGSALDYSPYTKFSIHLPYIGTRELNTDDIMGKTLQVKYNIDILSGACTAMIKCGGSILYEFSGACATAIPVTGQNWTQLVTSCIQLAGAGIAVAASGGSAAGLLPSTANAVMAMKPNIQRTGAVSGSAGMLGVQQPYLIWELPRQSLAQNYNTFVGYPSNITALLSTLSGFTQIESVHIENIPATQNELTEIETLLKEGVII